MLSTAAAGAAVARRSGCSSKPATISCILSSSSSSLTSSHPHHPLLRRCYTHHPTTTITKRFISSSHMRAMAARRQTLQSMGEGYLGSLGQGDFQPRSAYTPITSLSRFYIQDFAAGWAHSAVLTKCGRLFLFGRPHDVRKALSLRHMWQIFPVLVRLNQAMKSVLDAPSSDASTYYREDVLLTPREFPLPPNETPVRVACSGALTGIVTESGKVFCMGNNVFGQCGVGGKVIEGGKQKVAAADVANIWTPLTPVQGLGDEEEEMGGGRGEVVVDLALGFQHAICLTQEGKVYAWGKGERGQLGNGASVNHNSAFPVDLPADVKVTKIASGFNHAAALTSTGSVWVWGKWQGLSVKKEGGGGAAGVDLYEDQLLPREVVVPDGLEVVDVACGHFHTSLLVRGRGQKKEEKEERVFMFGMRAGVRTMEPTPTPVMLPGGGGGTGGGWGFGNGGAMTYTVLEKKGAGGGVYKAEFEGEGTQFVPVCAEEEELMILDGDGKKKENKKELVRYTEGLVHKLALVEEEEVEE